VRDGISKTGIMISPVYLVEERLHEGICPEVPANLTNCTIDYLTKDDVQTIADLPLRNIKREKFIGQLDQGQRCLAMKCNGELAAFIWIDRMKCSLSGCGFKLNDNEAFLFDAYTVAKFRGRGIAPYLRYECYKRLAEEGRTNIYSAVDVFNGSALKVLKKLNARKLELWMRIFFFGKRHIIFHMKRYHFGDDTIRAVRA
jgi:ribosomal protein S18 acetylase RimI-like enzyme